MTSATLQAVSAEHTYMPCDYTAQATPTIKLC